MADTSSEFVFKPIGIVKSCFTELFGIPRQPGLAPTAEGKILICPPFANEQAFAGLEECSHVWLQFIFHANEAEWRPKVRPPRLGGNKSLGVFATRSPNRPNPIGLSVVAYRGWSKDNGNFYIHVAGLDLLDGTPILDIKPYVPYADALANAYNHIAAEPPACHPVVFSSVAQAVIDKWKTEKDATDLERLIREILQQDPRPKYQRIDTERIYGMSLYDLNVRWRYVPNEKADFFIEVVEIGNKV
jgi:tRNA-Thr(GGU) m(6)t(6)A37 methyltransferase TsaA